MDQRLDLETLAALCDVFVPAVRPPSTLADDPTGYFGLTASAAGTSDAVAAALPTLLDDQQLDELATLLRVLRGARLGSLPQPVANGLLAALAAADEDAATGIDGLRRLTRALHHGGVGSDASRPVWEQLEYPGPPEVTPPPGGRLATTRPSAQAVADGTWRLGADVVVVGSGAGGGVVAARLAAAGQDVLVLEAGPDLQERDFPTTEVAALQAMYWRGGLVTTEDENVGIVAGATLGGGTTVNWGNWVEPPAVVRAEWAEHGLEGLDGSAFDDDLAAVSTRVGATDAGTVTNGANERLLEGAKALGWDVHLTVRNSDPELEVDDATGHTGFGDRSGAKQGSLRTWLRDAVAAGARIVADCEVARVTSSDGHATGVMAWWSGPDGERVRVEVTAPTVVLAAGALETPGVLLRSGIGGPATGRFLRVHPVVAVHGLYDELQTGFTRAPQGVVVDEFATAWGGFGYLLETAHWHPGLTAAMLQWHDPRDLKLIMGRFGRIAPFLAVTREHGGGYITLGADGRPLPHYPLDDELDRQVLRRGVRHLIEAHAAAGARTVLDATAPGRRIWRRGDAVRPFADRCASVPLGGDGRRFVSAHQMGTARMGRDPRTSVADPDGQLHDVRGVWVGDSSAFPSAVGSNPMYTIMALAHRTAGRILAQG